MTKTADIVIVGAGVFGLSVARALSERGGKCLVLEAREIGAGASGGLLGALMPHVPDQWNAKKAFQFDALRSLPAHIKAIELETGLSTGYQRLGRLMPIKSENDLSIARARMKDAQENWQTEQTGLSFAPHQDERFAHWLAPDIAPLGYILDTLAAKIAPRDYLKALAASLSGRSEIKTGVGVRALDAERKRIETSAGETITFGKLVLAMGYETFPLIAPLLAPLTAKSAGSGVKGQSALLRLEKPLPHPSPPVIYYDGVYIVPQGSDLVAIGSTSETDWQEPNTVDVRLEPLIEKAFALSPALKNAQVIERWAGVRPKARRRDPLIGPLPGHDEIYLATGGFKIGFGIAHLIGALMADILTDTPLHRPLPESFTPQHHLEL